MTGSGIGIPKARQDEIFEAFQQVDGSTSRTYGGTGLGLSISKELTRLLGGRIFLESTEGAAAPLHVLPERARRQHPGRHHRTEVSSAERQPVNPWQQKSKQQQRPSAPLKRHRARAAGSSPHPGTTRGQRQGRPQALLPATDPFSSSRMTTNLPAILRDFAEERGFKCIIAENGESGLHFAEYYRPSAILLDMGLPGIDGWTVMSRLKENRPCGTFRSTSSPRRTAP